MTRPERRSGPAEDKTGDKCCLNTCYEKSKRAFSNVFIRYAMIVGRYPVPFIVLPILIFGGLGAGLLAMDEEKDLEKLYFPMDSRAVKDRQVVRDTFENVNNVSYNVFSQSDEEQAATLLFVSQNGSIFGSDCLREIRNVFNQVKELNYTVNEQVMTFVNVCAMFRSECVVDGEYVLSPGFQNALSARAVTFPYWGPANTTLDLSTAVSGVETQTGGILTSATVLKISFKLAQKTPEWQKQFETLAENLNPEFTEVTYETPDSLSVELDKSTAGDIVFFSLTITLCCTYASVVTTGGNPVSTRGMLAFGGILAAGLGIVGSMGLLSVCGVKFVNIVGVIPFLIIGIGIDDMFLMMSAWSETLGHRHLSVPCRLGKTLATAGIGITITSVTDFLAFVIGTTSVFRSVTNFSLYAGVAVLFCYLANVTMFSGCLAIHGRRVYSSRHSFTCRKTKPREELVKQGHSACVALCCGGSPPDQDRADESFCEKFPSLILPRLFDSRLMCVAIVFAFLGYLATAIYGLIHLPQGLVLQNLVQDTSYYLRFLNLRDQYFPTTVPVGFVVDGEVDYSGSDGQRFLDLLNEARQDSEMMADFERCWLTSYLNSSFYSSTAPQDFVSNLRNYLALTPDFQADVVLDDTNTSIVASRCFIMSKPSNDQYATADLMERLRELADVSSLPVFTYHWSFVAYEQFLAVLPATLLMVGCAVAVMTVVTFIFLPHILMVFLVVLTIVMILVGIFGFLYYWDLTLSSITMIHLVMSVGFSVDFSAHVCAAYLMSNSVTRKERAKDAIRHAAGPILNGATSTLLGIILLVASSSYIFQSFFKVMLTVIVLGMLHAVFFLPAVLSLLGPQTSNSESTEPQRPPTPPPDYK